MIRVFEGDRVVVDFANHPDNARAHQVEFHAATAPAADPVTAATEPGTVSRFSFQALHPGLYLHHAHSARWHRDRRARFHGARRVPGHGPGPFPFGIQGGERDPPGARGEAAAGGPGIRAQGVRD